jgi:hypothetical protein
MGGCKTLPETASRFLGLAVLLAGVRLSCPEGKLPLKKS